MKKITFLADATNAHMEKWVFALQEDFEIQIVTPVKNSLLGSHIEQVMYQQNPGKSFPFRQLGLFLEIFRVKRNIKSFHPDIVHVHYALAHPIMYALPKSIPLVTSLWGSDIIPLPGKSITDKFLKYLRLYVARSQAITVTSKYLEGMFRKLFLNSPVQPKIIPFGIDTSLFVPTSNAVDTKTGPVVVGFARAFLRHYGFLDLLEAATPLIREGLITLKVAGSGEEEQLYREEVKRLGVEASVNFVGRISPVTKMPSFYQSIDIFVSPSYRESFGVAALEAASCEVPVIATNIGGLRETIADGVNGLLVPRGDVEALRQALKKLAQDSSLRKKLGEAGRKKVQAEYEWKHNVEQMKQLYESIIK